MDSPVGVVVGEMDLSDWGSMGDRFVWITSSEVAFRHRVVEDPAMATRTTVLLEDDLDGGKAAETVSFGVDNSLFEIDLSTKNARQLRKALEQYLAAGRRVGAARATRGRTTGVRSGSVGENDAAVIREWARANGHEVSSRGRIRAEIREAYLSA
jgi:hypothetical protein